MDPLQALQDSSNMIQQFASVLGMGFDPNPLHSTVVQSALNPQTAPAAGNQPGVNVSASATAPGFSAFGFTQNEILLGVAGIGILLLLKKKR